MVLLRYDGVTHTYIREVSHQYEYDLTTTNTSSILFPQIIKWYCICKRKMPTCRSKSSKSCSFATSRTFLNVSTYPQSDDVFVIVIVFVLVRNLPIKKWPKVTSYGARIWHAQYLRRMRGWQTRIRADKGVHPTTHITVESLANFI
jgi:hypothetical protein